MRKTRHNKAPKMEILLEAQKQAESIFTNLNLGDSLRRVAEFHKQVHQITRPVVQAVASMRNGEIKMTISSPRRPVTADEVQYIVNQSISKLSKNQSTFSSEIIYTKDKSLLRTLSGKEFLYKFTGHKKRISVIEAIIDSEKEVPTSILAKIAECPNDNALRKLIQGINTQTKSKLRLKNKLIEHRDGFGYRINKNLSIIKE